MTGIEFGLARGVKLPLQLYRRRMQRLSGRLLRIHVPSKVDVLLLPEEGAPRGPQCIAAGIAELVDQAEVRIARGAAVHPARERVREHLHEAATIVRMDLGAAPFRIPADLHLECGDRFGALAIGRTRPAEGV